MIIMRSKGALPVPYIVAIIIAIIVIVVLVVWFFVLSGQGNTQALDKICRATEFTYCTAWAVNGYDYSKIPGGKTGFCCGPDSYADSCNPLDWARQVNAPECRSLFGQGGATTATVSK